MPDHEALLYWCLGRQSKEGICMLGMQRALGVIRNQSRVAANRTETDKSSQLQLAGCYTDSITLKGRPHPSCSPCFFQPQ